MWIASYLPVAVGRTPAETLRLGLSVTLLFAFLPVVVFLASASPNLKLALLGSTSFLLVSKSMDSLSYSLFRPHADAPSLGYAMLACWLAVRPGALTLRRVVCVALLAWFSVLSKQVMFPILMALPLWFLLAHGRREGLRLVGWLSVTGGSVIGVAMLLFGLEGVLFNTVIIPSRVGWQLGDYSRIEALWGVTAELVAHSIPVVTLFTVGAVLSVVVRPPSMTSFARLRPFLADNSWVLPALVALTMVPVSVLGRVKIGGAINTFSPTEYFLLAAGILAMIGVPHRLKDHVGQVHHQASLGLIALCALVLASGGAQHTQKSANELPVREHKSQQAYDYLTREDSRAYFPMHPLAHLLANGSLFHLAMALYDRENLARLPLSDEQRYAHLPVNPSVVCWDPAHGGEYIRANYFREYAHAAEIDSLGPGWHCYTR
jgi:hypothetical protein